MKNMSWLNQSQLQKALAGYTILTFSLVITATLYNLGTRNVPMVFEGSQGMEELVEKDRSDSSNNLSMPDSEMERFYNKSTNSLPSKTLPHLVVKYTGRSGEGSKLTTAIQQPSNNDTRRTFKSSPGYVVSLHFWEQLTMATQNLIDLQCWAAKHKLVVVQPLISETYTRFTFSDALSSSWLRMDDLYNMSDWKQFSARNGLAPLVDRDQFLELATEQEMKVILVHFNYKKLNECTFDWPDGFDKAVQFALEHWHVVRNVCIIKPRIPTSVENLNRQIYGSFYPPRNVIVVFNMWRGIGGDRVPIPLSCSVGRKYMCQKKASDKLVWDTKAYAEKYLGGLGKYHAIVARFEKPVRSLGIDKAQMQEAIRTQIRQVLAKWKATKRMTSLSSTFLSFDYGSFGSDTFQKKDYYGAKDILIQFHQTVYANNMSIAEWEDTFEVITHTRHTAYIAQLQLQLAAHARCLFIVGIDSNFHHSVQQTYKNYHPTKRCIHVIGNVLQIPCYVY